MNENSVSHEISPSKDSAQKFRQRLWAKAHSMVWNGQRQDFH
ncbi:MAG: hypothetical protein N3B10_03555 [Armatimonadetes bacterium]|nr:hypothetical protein [Armatimonadota bacterium]